MQMQESYESYQRSMRFLRYWMCGRFLCLVFDMKIYKKYKITKKSKKIKKTIDSFCRR